MDRANMNDNKLLHILIFCTLDQNYLFPFTCQQPIDWLIASIYKGTFYSEDVDEMVKNAIHGSDKMLFFSFFSIKVPIRQLGLSVRVKLWHVEHFPTDSDLRFRPANGCGNG